MLGSVTSIIEKYSIEDFSTIDSSSLLDDYLASYLLISSGGYGVMALQDKVSLLRLKMRDEIMKRMK